MASGPFRIQDINDSVSGELNVRVEEQDGSVQQFVVNTASIPYLTRPGSVRFKLAAGKPSDWEHHSRAARYSAPVNFPGGSATAGRCTGRASGRGL
ncbi:Outer membrane usher protein papC precursor [Serratia fonticola]|uniref:Outer membrane usher protein papC n=1 Tax=Serratia fonticola TaxID=47917 RepID=A0A4U9TPC8_SERFO|nr:Outer membrane usher protein papC precursor [Serratia fonticola]